MQIPKGLLVAGGIGALAVGGYMLFGRGDKKEGADPASKDVNPALAGAGGEKAGPTAGTPTGGLPGAGGGGLPGAGGAQDAATGAATGGAPAGARQVEGYTIIPDPASGAEVVFETATKQLVGVLDAQGNLLPATVDAQGNISVDPNAAPAGAGGAGLTSPTPGVDPMAGSVTSSPIGAGTGTAAPTSAAEGAQYRSIAESLFANAGDGSAGAAVSGAMTGSSTLGTTPTGTTTTTTTMPGATTGYASPQTAVSSAPVTGTTTGATSGAAAGQLAVVKDPQSGLDIVFDPATNQPVGVLDPATGSVIPIEQLQAQANAASAGAATGASSLAPSPYGSTAPAATGSAPIGVGY